MTILKWQSKSIALIIFGNWWLSAAVFNFDRIIPGVVYSFKGLESKASALIYNATKVIIPTETPTHFIKFPTTSTKKPLCKQFQLSNHFLNPKPTSLTILQRSHQRHHTRTSSHYNISQTHVTGENRERASLFLAHTSMQLNQTYDDMCKQRFRLNFRGIVRNNSFWDMLVFRKVQEGMGGRLRLMLVGSAPLAENVLTFTRCALGCLVCH